MKNNSLLKRLSKLGFPLLEIEEIRDTNATLAEVVESKDIRLWEGFPVVLANCAEKDLFNYDKINQHFKKSFLKAYLDSLILMSLALYKVLNLKFSWATKFYQSLPVNKKNEFNNLTIRLKKNADFKIADRIISSVRLKSTFNNYYRQVQTEINDLFVLREQFGLEYALAQIFSPKQKELFLKKVKREKLTKTEREYFSRVVKKKVLALSNPELHHLSQKLLE